MMNQRIIQAYRQAPWRVQLQWIGVSFLILVVTMLVAGIYLYISAQATEAGTKIQQYEYTREELQIRIADLRTQLAQANSAAIMRTRAQEQGFRPASQDEMVYIRVDGYAGRKITFLAPPPGEPVKEISLIKPAYRQSLWDWIFQGTTQLSQSMGGNQ